MHTDDVDGEERIKVVARRLILLIVAAACSGGVINAFDMAEIVRARAMTVPFMARQAETPGTERALEAMAKIAPAPKSAAAPKIQTVANAMPLVGADTNSRADDVLPVVVPRLMDAAPQVEAVPQVEAAPQAATVPQIEAPEVQTPPQADAAPSAGNGLVFSLQSIDPSSMPADDVLDDTNPVVLSMLPVTIAPPPSSHPGLANVDAGFEAALTKLAVSVAGLQAGLVGEMPVIEIPGEEIPTVPFKGKQPTKPASVAVTAPAIEVAQPTPVVAMPEAPPVQLPKLSEVPMPRPKPPLTPAQELGLEGKERAKAENCLARAIYFEARSEPVRGQIAVAQVVLNRVFSPYYPGDICGVVYQNAHRRLSCQFTFACDGIPDIVRDRGSWNRAQRIAKQALDHQVWLPDVAKSTHYHATYVRPYWIREMRKMVKHGQHIFYRPHRWGDGSDEVGWGVASLVTQKTTPPQKIKLTRRH